MRVLVVEDEPELLAAVAGALREEGYAVDEAADGEDGLFKAMSWDYDAVVLDLMLPGLDGWQGVHHEPARAGVRHRCVSRSAGGCRRGTRACWRPSSPGTPASSTPRPGPHGCATSTPN